MGIQGRFGPYARDPSGVGAARALAMCSERPSGWNRSAQALPERPSRAAGKRGNRRVLSGPGVLAGDAVGPQRRREAVQVGHRDRQLGGAHEPDPDPLAEGQADAAAGRRAEADLLVAETDGPAQSDDAPLLTYR